MNWYIVIYVLCIYKHIDDKLITSALYNLYFLLVLFTFVIALGSVFLAVKNMIQVATTPTYLEYEVSIFISLVSIWNLGHHIYNHFYLSNARESKELQIVNLNPKYNLNMNPKDTTMSRGSAIGFNKLVFDALCKAHANYWNLSSC